MKKIALECALDISEFTNMSMTDRKFQYIKIKSMFKANILISIAPCVEHEHI